MSDRLITYRSLNSAPEHQWLGYIHTEAGRLNMAFFGETEEAVKAEMRKFWAKDKEVRDANRKRRDEVKAAAAAKAAKKQDEAA